MIPTDSPPRYCAPAVTDINAQWRRNRRKIAGGAAGLPGRWRFCLFFRAPKIPLGPRRERHKGCCAGRARRQRVKSHKRNTISPVKGISQRIHWPAGRDNVAIVAVRRRRRARCRRCNAARPAPCLYGGARHFLITDRHTGPALHTHGLAAGIYTQRDTGATGAVGQLSR